MKRTVQQSVLRGALALSVLALALAATEARASTAANTQITNTATVNFNDAGGVAQTPVTATVTVTVTLVPSAVVLSSPANQSIAQGTSATLVYTVTSTANGPDTYNLSSSDTLANITGGTATPPANVVLGGTTLAAAANNGDTTITVPYDGVAGASVNGIAVGDTIVVGANAYVVSSVVKNAPANTAAVGLASAIAGGSVAAGQVVGERQTFNVIVTSGTVTAGASGTETVSTTATSATAPNPATTQTTPTVVTVNRPTLTVTKEVSIDGGTTFVASANATPGTSLVYKVIAHNTGATPASAVSFTDVIPAYLTYVAGQSKYATAAATTYAAATALVEGAGGLTFAAGTVTYNPGGATGTVAANGDLVLFFRATIN